MNKTDFLLVTKEARIIEEFCSSNNEVETKTVHLKKRERERKNNKTV
jgi:hypothetical protein